MKHFYLIFSLILAISFSELKADVLYVKPGTASTAWQNQTNIYSDLQTALAAAVAGDEVWVAAGIYKPTTSGDRDISFELKDGVHYYGGFAGDETDLAQRDWRLNETILSGDIGVEGDNSDNSYHVVTLSEAADVNLNYRTIVDGFIVEDGKGSSGTGFYIYDGDPILKNCWFRRNQGSSNGGGVYSLLNARPLFGNVIFSFNSGRYGGAVYAERQALFYNCTWYKNYAEMAGAALFTSTSATTVYNSLEVLNECGEYDNTYFSNSDEYSTLSFHEEINYKPLFVDPMNGDFRLAEGSIAVDGGDNSYLPDWLLTDYSGNSRIQNEVVDLGVFEGAVAVPALQFPEHNHVFGIDVSSVELTWDWETFAPENLVDYTLEYSVNGGEMVQGTETSVASHTISGLSEGTTVNWRVCANLSDGTKRWSPYRQFFIQRSHPLYVKPGATGSGASWSDAINLSDAMKIAFPGEQIWVAAGIYTPTTGDSRDESFEIRCDLALMGGFSGNETSPDERDWIQNQTILSGDIGVEGVNTDNSYHVIKMVGSENAQITEATVIDGIIVENGYSGYNSNNILSNGAGMWLQYASPIVRNVIFRGNTVTYGSGGAVYGDASSAASFGNIVFHNNSTTYYYGYGGAVNSYGGFEFYNCVWYDNYSDYYGGAVYGNSVVVNSIAWNNISADGYNDFYSNVSKQNTLYADADDSNGNISGDPLFVALDKGDFRLRVGSPVLNAGNNEEVPEWLTKDFFGAERIQDGIVDMGVSEGTVFTPKPLSPADSTVFESDQTSVLFEWEWVDTPPADVESYILEYRINENEPVSVENIAGFSYTLTGLTPGSLVQWRVASVDASGTENWSEFYCFSVLRGHPLYVIPDGIGTGSSWSDAMNLQAAIDLSVEGDSIWAAKGIYYPTTTSDRDVSFELKENVKIFGGFAGNETSFSERNLRDNQTILSGNIGDEGLKTDNSTRILEVKGTSQEPLSEKTVLDGFIIEGGYGYNGAGIYILDASIIIRNLWIRDNYSSGVGGAVYVSNSSPKFGNVLFTNNSSADEGGAVYSPGSAEYYNCTWFGNSANGIGGSVYGNATITNSISWGNYSGLYDNEFSSGNNVRNSIYETRDEINGNVSVDPMFVAPEKNDFRLLAGSPGLNTGVNEDVPEWLTSDRLGADRIQESVVDVGMSEGGVVAPVLLSPEHKTYFESGNSSILLEWGQPSNVESYLVEFSLNGAEPVLMEYIQGLSYTLAGLNPGTVVAWRVCSVDASGRKTWSEQHHFSVLRGHPLFVTPDGTGEGTSWTDAMNLQEALGNAVDGDSIWVAAGTYKPTETIDREISFVLTENIKMFGGFAGTETEFSERNHIKNKTILSGDIGVEDVITDNSFHVLSAVGVTKERDDWNAVVDGFVIEDGYADGSGHNNGGGLYLEWASPLFVNVHFKNNYALYDGGAVYDAVGSQAEFGNVLFTNNTSESEGGAVYAKKYLRFYNCVWFKNSSRSDGGAAYGRNKIVNSIFWKNSTQNNYNNDLSRQELVSYTIYDKGNGDFNLKGDPGFVDAENGDFRLRDESIALNAGSNDALPEWLTTDYFGNSRILADTVDIGISEGAVVGPVLLVPENQSVLSIVEGTTIMLKWAMEDSEVAATISDYQLEYVIGEDTTLVENIEGYDYGLSGLSPLDAVKWRVGYVDGSGNTNWSVYASFSIYRGHPLFVVANGAGDGSSWETGIDLKDALSIAAKGDSLWISAGMYKPSVTVTRDSSFVINKDMKLFGGFSGVETFFEERNTHKNQVVLSGDIGEPGVEGDNSYHVVRITGSLEQPVTEQMILDGVTIEGGFADVYENTEGGGLIINSASPIIKNVWFRNNYASYYGGAVYANSGSNPQFGNVLFHDNKSGNNGGGVYSQTQVKFYNCVWSGNYSGYYGGAVYDNSSTSLVYNSIAWGNEARWGYDNFHYGVSSFYSIFNNAADQNGNLNHDPDFVSVDKEDFRLKEGSPAINSGNNDHMPDWLISDFYGNSRVLEDTVDIGIAEGAVVAPTLLSPSPDSVYHINSDETVLFEWTVEDASVLENISAFQLEYIVNSDTIIIEEIAEQRYEIGGFQPKDTVSWSVSYIDEQGFTTWSSSSSFFIGRGRPVFVTTDGIGDGSSWENSIGLKDALISAVPGDSLWVASGIYTPTTTSDRSISFELRNNVKLFGGFAGTESSFEERNWNINRTVLSGDIGETEVATDNTYQVVRMVGTSEKPVSAKTIIDGVVIEGGYADSSSSNDGGGLFLLWASPVVKNVWFRNHFSYDDGGAVYGYSESRAEFGNVIFTNNESGDDGGAVYSYSGFKFYNCVWYDNYSGYWGGAARGNMLIINSISWNNQAERGSDDFSGSYSINNSIYPSASNSSGNIFENPNFVDGGNSDFRLTENSPAINNGNADVVPDWLTEDYYGNARVLEDTIDIGVAEGFVIVPVLESPEDGSVCFRNENSEIVLDWSLDASVSENISAYKLEYIVNSLDTIVVDDIAEQQFTLNGISPTDSVKWRVAYEDNNDLFNWSLSSLFTVYRGHPLFVVPDGTGDGSSWTSATNLQNALDVSVSGDSIWVAAGTYKPTNTDDRNIFFEIKENVKLFGGFAGIEDTFSERNLVENQTILSGDIGEEGVDTDNSYHVLQMIGRQAAPITLKTVVDGLVIEKGYADEDYIGGGGLLLERASPIVRNVWFRYNYVVRYGGAVYGDNESHARFGNVLFTNNESGYDGGAVNSHGNMQFYNCVWYGNISGDFGGAVISNNAIVNNSIAWGNSAEVYADFVYTVDVTNSIYSGGSSGDDNISQNPDFVDPANDDFRLKEGSPAINAGSTENLPDWLVTDYYGNFRVEEDIVDIGAIEGWVITPTLVSPADKSWFEAGVTETTLEWGWNDSIPNNVNGFAVEYVINGGEPQLIENLTALETELTGIQSADVVSWRVSSLENTGFTNWSESRTFTVNRDHPLYVKPGATGNGTSWLDAMDLRDAMAISIENDEIWVAAGTYKPTEDSERNAAFELKNGMKLYGGFGGFESSVEERDWMANETILSGDIGVEGVVNDNSYNVVRIRGTEDRLFEDNVVDGFIIEKGKAQNDGGGVYIRWSSPELRNIWLRDNQADRWGGAVYTENGSNSTFSNVLFVNNSAVSAGAAVLAASDATFTNCLWYGNTTTNIGGAIYRQFSGSVKINNSISWNNQASADSDFSFTSGIANSVFADADGSNGNIAKDPLFVDADNSIFHLQKGSPAINAGDNDLLADELLTDYAGFDRTFGDNVDIGPFEYLQIQPVAPANGGSGTKEYSMLMMLNLVWGISDGTIEPQINIPSDFEYQMKLWKVGDEDNPLEDGSFSARSGIDGTNNSTIIGGLEYGSVYQWTIGLDYGDYVNWSEPSTFYIGHDYTIKVKEGSTGTTGASWDDAFGTLHEALDFALPGDEIWVAEGKYYPVTPADPNNVTQTEREQALSLKPGVIIYGGLAGDESNAWNRNHVEHPVILSGDIGVSGDDSDNSIHLFRNEFDAGTPLEQGAVIEGFIFEDATGSAIYNVNASPSVEFSVFRNNMGDDGGAVYNEGSSPRFFNVLFHDNEASGNGGAIYADENSQPELLSCTVAHNRATNTGGLYGYFDVKNSIVYANENGAFSDDASLVVYSCVEGGYEGEENISYDPMWTDPENRDYSLQEFSTCIEQGSNQWFTELFGYDLAKNSRTHWLNTDIGAFEATENGKLEIVESSVEADGLTDFINSITIRFNQPIAIDTTISPLINPVVDAEIKVSQEDPAVLIISHPGLQASTDYHLELPGGQVTLANNDQIIQWFVEYDFTTRACVPVVLSVDNPDVTVCSRTSVTLGVDIEGDAMDYSWVFNDQEVIVADSDTLFIESVMPENTGSYTVSVNDWCGSTDEVTLNLQYKAGTELVIPEPKWNTVYFVDNSSGSLSEFRWYLNGEEISQKQYVDVKSMSNGDLTVRAFDEASQCLVYGEVESLKSASLKSAVVSPNPVVAGNPVDIFLPVVSEQSRIRLYDMRGGLLIDREFGESSILQLEDTDLSSGVYLLQIEYNDGFIENKKLIIE